MTKNPLRVEIPAEYTKTGNSRIAFISSEAKETILQWLKVRDQYIVSSSGRSGANERWGKLTEEDKERMKEARIEKLKTNLWITILIYTECRLSSIKCLYSTFMIITLRPINRNTKRNGIIGYFLPDKYNIGWIQ